MTLEDLLGRTGFLFLSSPYSRYTPGLAAATYDAQRHAAHLINLGFVVYSPIAHAHQIAKVGGIDPLDHELWMRQGEPFMESASAMVALKLPGWRDSVGMELEREAFIRMRKPIVEMEPLP